MVYVAALLMVAGVALYVAAPLVGAREDRGKSKDTDFEMENLMHDRALAVQALREIEFDREMNKLSDNDYRVLRAPVEARALGAMAAIERLRADRQAAPSAPMEPQQPLPPAEPVARRVRRVAFCPQCGSKIRPEGSFCVNCGSSLNPVRSPAAQAE